MEPEDLDLLYAIENDRALWDLGATNVPYSRYVLHDYIANAKNDIYADGQVRMIIENEGGEVVGLIDMMNHDAKNNKAELGIVVMNRYRRQGYASAAISQMPTMPSKSCCTFMLPGCATGSLTAKNMLMRYFFRLFYKKSGEIFCGFRFYSYLCIRKRKTALWCVSSVG